MEDPKVLERMRADWNQRASEDAYYYVAFGRREQDDEEFFATAADVVRGLTAELKRLAKRDAALEIGCGPGRLMRPMSRHFGEIHGVDVSDEMIRLARERLRGIENAHPQVTPRSDLSMFPDAKFDFVYSYAVFQHIPSREVVFGYLREAWRVLKPGGVIRCQLNGLPATAKQYDTWSGVRVSPDEIRDFARAQRFQLLALEDIWTQYMWVTMRKSSAGPLVRSGWPASHAQGMALRHITNALTSEPAVPNSGPLAAISLSVANFPQDADLLNTTVTADGRDCRPVYIGPPAHDGVTQVNAILPEGIRTGIVPVTIGAAAGAVRIVPAGPLVPRMTRITDGVNLLLHQRTTSGTIKVVIKDLANPEEFRATIDDRPARELDWFCTDRTKQIYEFNFHLPEGTQPGGHVLRVAVGKREFPALGIEVA
jgi:SAM-dependent methyltransferase